MRKYMLMALLLLVAVPTLAQQTRVNIQYDPQRNTEGILPFSTQVLSPEVRDDHTVIFRVKAPDAKSVQLTGSMFVGKEARKRVDFTKGDDGVWTLTLGPLIPEIYFYYIIIDGVQNIVMPPCLRSACCLFTVTNQHGMIQNPMCPMEASPRTIISQK